jgi:hypothetical protein
MALKILYKPLRPNADLSRILDLSWFTRSPISNLERSSIFLAYEASGDV